MAHTIVAPVGALSGDPAGATPAEDIERCWAWLEHWGHRPCRIPLGLSYASLVRIRDQEQTRVRALAETWTVWW